MSKRARSEEVGMMASAATADEVGFEPVGQAADYNGPEDEVLTGIENFMHPIPNDDGTKQDDEFRTLCLNNPDMIHEFPLEDLILDHTRNGRVVERKITDDEVKQLANRIKANPRGQITPGEVTLALDGKLYITAGTGRYLALMLINTTRSKADKLLFKALVIVESTGSLQSIIDNAHENWGRLDITPLDKALIVSRLMDPTGPGLKATQVSEMLGVGKPEISVLRKIGGFPEQVKTWIMEGKISAHAAYDLAMDEPEKIEEKAKKLIDQAAGGRVSRSMASNVRAKKAKPGAEEGKSRKGKKQRTSKQVLMFINDEATAATDKKYGDKNLSAKLECFAKFVSGGTEDTFLKNLAAL